MLDWHYTPVEVAKLLDVVETQVLAWIHSKELVAFNVAKDPNGERPRWRISESEVCKFLVRRSNQDKFDRREKERIKAYLNK